MKYVVNTKKYSFKFGDLLKLKSLAVEAVSDELLAKLRNNFMFRELESSKTILVEDSRPVRGDDDNISVLKARIAELESELADAKASSGDVSETKVKRKRAAKKSESTDTSEGT